MTTHELYYLCFKAKSDVEVIYQTRGRVFHQIPKHCGSGLKKQSVSQVFFNQLRSVWISDEALFRVFHAASQSIDNSSRNSKQKMTEFHDN